MPARRKGRPPTSATYWPLVDVEPARDRMAAIDATPQDHEFSHLDGETRQIGRDTAVRHQDQRRSTTVASDGVLDLGEVTSAAFHVAERALQNIPRLRMPEGQTRGVQATAARARRVPPRPLAFYLCPGIESGLPMGTRPGIA